MTGLTWVTVATSIAALIRIVCIAASTSIQSWHGSAWRFGVLAATYVATCAALIAAIIDLRGATLMLMLALVLWVLSMRNPFKERP